MKSYLTRTLKEVSHAGRVKGNMRCLWVNTYRAPKLVLLLFFVHFMFYRLSCLRVFSDCFFVCCFFQPTRYFFGNKANHLSELFISIGSSTHSQMMPNVLFTSLAEVTRNLLYWRFLAMFLFCLRCFCGLTVPFHLVFLSTPV